VTVFRYDKIRRNVIRRAFGQLCPHKPSADAELRMSRRTMSKLRPLLMPGFSAILALLSMSSVPQSARAMVHAVAKWSAELAPPSGGAGPRGSVVVEPGRLPNQTRIRVVISGDTPGALRPWYLHTGQCGDAAPIVGPETAYSRIRINARGNGVAVIELPIPFPDAGALFVNVHDSLAVMGRIVTCGQLSR
jgi:hypothetical protein